MCRLAQISVPENKVLRLEIGVIGCYDSLLAIRVLKVEVLRLF